MKQLYIVLCCYSVFCGAFAVTCPSPTVSVSGGDASTFAAPNESTHCPAGYELYDAPSQFSAYFTGTLLSETVNLCGDGEYMNNGTCTAYAQGRCDSGYLDVSTDSSNVGAPNESDHCADGYATQTTPAGMYIISTGILLSTGATLCGSGQYMNNGVCTAYDNTRCPADWFDYAPTGVDTFVPMVDGACGTDYVASGDSADCTNRGNAGMCATLCASGELMTWGGHCASLCTGGGTELRIGSLVFPIYGQKTTTPAINIGFDSGTVCYVNLESGAANGTMNVAHSNGTTYHVTK